MTEGNNCKILSLCKLFFSALFRAINEQNDINTEIIFSTHKTLMS